MSPRPRIVFTTQANERTTLPMAKRWTAPLENRRPKRPLIRNPVKGSRGMLQSCIGYLSTAETQRRRENTKLGVNISVFHRVDIFDLQGRPVLENGQNDRQPHGRFRRRHHHHEEREQVSVHLLQLVRKGDEGQVDGVQHQLNRHEHGDDIAPEQETGHTQREQHRAERQKPRNGYFRHLVDFLSGEHDRAQNGDQDQQRRHFKGQQIRRKQRFADCLRGPPGEASKTHRGSAREQALHEERQEPEQSDQQGHAEQLNHERTPAAILRPRVQQQNDKDEQDHHGAGVHNYLRGGDEFGPEQQVQNRQRPHHANQRNGARDWMRLHHHIHRAHHRDDRKNEKENYVHLGEPRDQKTGHQQIHH